LADSPLTIAIRIDPSGSEVEYSFNDGKYTRTVRLADWREFGRGAEIIKKARAI